MHSTVELRERLEHWARSGSAETVGEAGSYAGRPWMFAEIGPERVAINADTTRAAVLAFLAFDGATDWTVVANRRGRVNRVVYRTDDDLQGWYCYLPRARGAAGPL